MIQHTQDDVIRIRRRIRGGGRAFFTAAGGATAIEFAIVIPTLMFLFMGVIEFSLIMYVSGVLDGATVSAARAGKTGFPIGGDRAGYVDDVLKGRTGGIMDPAKVILASQSYSDYDDISPLAACVVDDATCPHDLGAARKVVVYTASYSWPVVTPGLSSLIGDAEGNFIIQSTALVKNEPWDVGP